MKKTFVMALMLAVAGPAMCQLKSEGAVPADLKMSADELYQGDLRRAEIYTGGKVKEHDRAKLRQAAYEVGKMMAGGRIVYGDPVSRMVSRIADTLLKDYPELRKELRFYTVKSPEVNAFTTGQGMVFINAGLVAQVENEAQLAFILSHEIIHYYRNHSMEEIVGRHDGGQNMNKGDVKGDDSELNEFLRRHNRSHEMENECDSLGIAMFYLRSPYAMDVTEGVFDVLQYSALPFDDVEFDTTYFNTPYYQLLGCWLDTTANITSRDNYDDSRSTHPNILTRRRNTAAALDGYYGGEPYVVTTKAEFERIRQMARMECIRQELIYGEYSRAFYNAWLLHDDADMAQAIYSIAMSKIHNGTNSVTGDYRKIEGESQQVYYAMRRMSNEQATLAALHMIWRLHQSHPENTVYANMCDDLMEELHTSFRMSTLDFMTTPPDTIVKVEKEEVDNKPMTKYERIKQKRQAQTERSPYGYALTDLMMTDSLFNTSLRSHLKGTWKNGHEEQSTTKDTSNLIVYSPSYWVVNGTTDDIKVDESNRREHDLTNRVMQAGKRLGRGSVDFSDQSMRSMESADAYNDFILLNEWINEFWQTKGQFDLHRLTQPEMDDLMDRYAATTLSMTAVLNKENMSPEMSPGYLWLLPLAPVIAYNCFAGIEETQMVTLVVDARKGKILSRQSYRYDVADHDALLDAMLYDTYVRIKNPKKNPVGILGHRVALAGGANLGFAGHQPFSIDKGFSLTPWATLEFAIDRKWTIAATWSYQHGFDEFNSFTRNEQIVQNGYVVGHHDVYHTDMDYSKHMTTWSLTARHYSNTDFAPLGAYGGFGLHMMQYTNMSDGSNGGNAFGANVVAGRNYIFYKRLVLNIEARYGVTFANGSLFKKWSHDLPADQLYRLDGLVHNLLQLKVGIGFIAF